MPSKSKKSLILPEMRGFFACDSFTVDASGKKTLFGVFDTIWAEKVPSTYFNPIYLYAYLVGGNGHAIIGLNCIGPDNQPFFGGEIALEVDFKAGHTDVVIQLAGLPLNKVGKIKFGLTVNGQDLGWKYAIAVKKKVAK